MTDIQSGDTSFLAEDTQATSFGAAKTPERKKIGRPLGSKNKHPSTVPPPGDTGTPPKRKTAEERAAERKAKLRSRENEIVKSIKETVNPLIVQGFAMIPGLSPLMYEFEEKVDEEGKGHLQLHLVNEAPVVTEFGKTFYVNDLEARITAMSVARLDDMGAIGAKVADVSEKVMPYALVAALGVAGLMYARRTTAVMKQVAGKARTKPHLEERPVE